MKLRQIFEMPERIAQQEVTMPWNNINTSKVLAQSELEGSFPGYTLKIHPMKNGVQSAVLVYGQKGVVAGMLATISKPNGKTAVEVSGLLVSKSSRGSGIALSIYLTLAFKVGVVVVSDDVQTPGGAAIWKKIAGMYPAKVGVTEGELDEVVPLDSWTENDPFTNHFTRFVFSKTDIPKPEAAAKVA